MKSIPPRTDKQIERHRNRPVAGIHSIPLQVHLPPKLRARIDRKSFLEGKSVSKVVREALEAAMT